MKCEATTKNGEACQADAQTGKPVCFWHDEEQRDAAKEASARGGSVKREEVVVERMQLNTIYDVRAMLADTIHAVRERTMDTKRATCIGYLLTGLVKAIDAGELADRISVIEARLNA